MENYKGDVLLKKTLKDYCRNHKTNYGFDNPVAREASCLGHLESWVEQAVKEYENSSQITADTWTFEEIRNYHLENALRIRV